MPEIDLPTVIFALVALFVAYKLRSVLGMRQDSERRSGGLLAPLRRVPAPPTAPVVPPDARGRPPLRRLPRIGGRASPSPIPRSGAALTPSPQPIAASRRKPFFPAHGSPTTWSFMPSPPAIPRRCANLMTPEAFANFDNAIRSRAAAGQTMTTTVVSIDDATIVGAQLVGAAAQLGGAFRRQARLRHPRRPRRGRRRIAERRRRSYRFVDVRARHSLARSQLDADGDRIGRAEPPHSAKAQCEPASRRSGSKASRAGTTTTIWRRSALSSARRARWPAGRQSARPGAAAIPRIDRGRPRGASTRPSRPSAMRSSSSRRGFDLSASFPRTGQDF